MIKSPSRSIHLIPQLFSHLTNEIREDWFWNICILQQAPPSQLIFYKLSSNGSNLESTTLGIHFPITQQHFEKMRGKLKVIDEDSLSRFLSTSWVQYLFQLNSSTWCFAFIYLCLSTHSECKKRSAYLIKLNFILASLKYTAQPPTWQALTLIYLFFISRERPWNFWDTSLG